MPPTKLLKPVPKLVLKLAGAWPNPMNPVAGAVAKPLLKPPAKLLPVKLEPNRLVNPPVGRGAFDRACSAINGATAPPRRWKLLLNALDTDELKFVPPNGRFCNDEARLF